MCGYAQLWCIEISEKSHFQGDSWRKMIQCENTAHLPRSSVASGTAQILPGGCRRQQVG